MTLETVALSNRRESFRGPVNLRATLLVLGSVAFHAGIALLALMASRKPPSDSERDQLDLLRSYTARLAVSEHAAPEVHIEQSAPSVTPPAAKENVSAPALVTPPPKLGGKRGSDASLSSAPSVCAPPVAHGTTGPMCTRTVVVRSLTLSSPTCFSDVLVTVGESGTLTYPCSGDGPSELSFARGTFEGADIDGKVTVCTGSEYQVPSVDSCTWATAQQVTGSVRAGGTLRFSYGEAPKEPRHLCAAACTLTGSIEVE